MVIVCHSILQERHTVNQILSILQGNLFISQHGTQGGVIAEFHQQIPLIVTVVFIICPDALGYIIGYLAGFSQVKLVLEGVFRGDAGADIIQIIV